MTDMQFIIIVVVLALATLFTRALPFLLFGSREKMPKVIDYLGKVLPAAMMGLLVVYCFKDTNFSQMQEVLPFLIASAVVAGIHLWKRNFILSIVLGTAVYMILIRTVI